MIFNPRIAFMGTAKEYVVSEWSQFGKNAAHNMVVEQAPVASSPKTWELSLSNKSDRSNMHTVMHTLNVCVSCQPGVEQRNRLFILFRLRRRRLSVC